MATAKKKSVTEKRYLENLNGYVSNENLFAEKAAKYNKESEALNKKYKPTLDAIIAEQEGQKQVVELYCSENKEAMFASSQSIEVNGVKIGFKNGKPKVGLAATPQNKEEEKTLWEKALELIKKKLPSYIRSEESISKAKLLEDKDTPEVAKNLEKCGLCIEQEETFFIKVGK